jgi:hypothetical protein
MVSHRVIGAQNAIHEDLRTRIYRIFNDWLDLLEMRWLAVTVSCSDAAHAEDAWCAADTDAKWEYRQAKITVYLPTVANHDDADLEDIIVHELCHVLLAPMESLRKDSETKACELAVENTARALIAARGARR